MMSSQMQDIVISNYLNIMAFIAVAGLLIVSPRVNSSKDPGMKFFRIMCINVAVCALFNVLSYGLHHKDPTRFIWLAQLAKTIVEICVFHFCYCWLLFIGYLSHGSMDHLRRRYKPFLAVLVFFALLIIVDSFTGIMFRVTNDLDYFARPLYYVMLATEYFFILLSVYIAYKHNRRTDRAHFLYVAPILIAIFAGTFELVVSKYATGPIGYAAGLTFIYFSMTARWQYEDIETSCYNRAYLSYLMELPPQKAKNYRSVMLFEFTGDPATVAEILKAVLPRDGELVRISRQTFGLLMVQDGADFEDLIALTVQDAVAAYTDSHEGAGIDIRPSLVRRQTEQTAAELIGSLTGPAQEGAPA